MRNIRSLALAALATFSFSALAQQGAPPIVSLTPAEQATVATGQPIYRQSTTGNGVGTGLAVFRVNASPASVWSVITNFSQYPNWVDGISLAETYKSEGSEIYVHFQIQKFFSTVDYYIHHTFSTANGWATWTLDQNKKSDLELSKGFWRVDAVPGNPNQSTITYDIAVKISGFLSIFQDFIAKQGLQNATAWVKKQSEAQFNSQN